MSKKKKNTAADIKRRLIDDDRDISPFASIKLVEKKEEPKKARPQVKPERKKPSEIVQGYDPSSSFADILYSFEHTGNPYSMPSPSKGKVRQGALDFGAILDKWEGKGTKQQKKPSDARKSTYVPSRSFGDILDSFEGKGQRKTAQDTEAAVEKKEHPAAHEAASKPLSENLFRKAGDGDSVSPSASWTIFGGRNDGFVRKEPEKAAVSEERVPEERRRAHYHPTKSFEEILQSYEGHAAVKKTEPSAQAEVKAAPPAEPPLSENLFRKPGADGAAADNVSWSVFGGRNSNFVRKEMAEPEGNASDHGSGGREGHYRPSSSFGAILERYSKEPESVKTFEEYMKEKGDDEKKHETLTLSRLRTMPPQSTLDLHGYTAAEAERAVRQFLSECHENGIRKISIITGKGLHSEDGVGVLKTTVQSVLDESGLVSEKASAPLSAGGSGALWIILKA